MNEAEFELLVLSFLGAVAVIPAQHTAMHAGHSCLLLRNGTAPVCYRLNGANMSPIPCEFRCSAGDFGWDPLGLGANKERLTWFAESERVHCRWAMLGVAGILVQVRFASIMIHHLSSFPGYLPGIGKLCSQDPMLMMAILCCWALTQ